MGKTIFWVWNGWGLLFTGVLAFSMFLSILVREKFGSGTPLRKPLPLVDIIALVLTFVLSGWVAGLLALPIGLVGGVILAWLLIPIRIVADLVAKIYSLPIFVLMKLSEDREKIFVLMKFTSYIICSIPTLLVSWFFGAIPWGIVTALATAIGIVIFAVAFPKKRYIRININTAMESLSYGYLDDAKDFILIAIREAKSASKLERSVIKDIRDACDQISSALEKTGEFKEAQSLRERCSSLYEQCANCE